MTRSELIAFRYGQAVTREALAYKAMGRGKDYPSRCWMGPDEYSAIDALGLRRFNDWMVKGGQDQLRASGDMQ